MMNELMELPNEILLKILKYTMVDINSFPNEILWKDFKSSYGNISFLSKLRLVCRRFKDIIELIFSKYKNIQLYGTPTKRWDKRLLNYQYIKFHAKFMKNITGLSLIDCQDINFSLLRSYFPKTTMLILKNCTISQLTQLYRNFSDIKQLHVQTTSINKIFFHGFLSTFKELEILNILNRVISFEQVLPYHIPPKLKILRCSYIIYSENFDKLLENYSCINENLTELTIIIDFFNEKTIDSLLRFKKLENLGFIFTKSTVYKFDKYLIKIVSNLKNLKQLYFGCDNRVLITSISMNAIVEYLPRIEQIRFYKCNFDYHCFEKLSKLKYLNRLCLNNPQHISDNDIIYFIKNSKRLKHLTLLDSHYIDEPVLVEFYEKALFSKTKSFKIEYSGIFTQQNLVFPQNLTRIIGRGQRRL